MKIKNSFVLKLIDAPNPIDPIFEYILQILSTERGSYYQNSNKIKKFYDKEVQIKTLEDFLLKSFPEIYDKYLVENCLKVKKLKEKLPLIFMDGLSLREAILFSHDLKANFSVNLEFSYSSLPSDTINFKSLLNINLSKIKLGVINDFDLTPIKGNEEIFWSRFPDSYLESIQEGRTRIQTIPEVYNKTFKLLEDLLEKIEFDDITIISDHGYVILEPEFIIPVEPSMQKLIARIMGGGRFKKASEVNADKFVKEGYLIKANDNYIAKSRYTWPISGKFKVFQHGGISLLECITPVLTIKK